MAVAMGIGRFVYTPILPGMMQQLGLSAADAGLIASANYLGYLVGAVLAAGGWAEGHERLHHACRPRRQRAARRGHGLHRQPRHLPGVRFLAGLASAFVMVFLASIVFSHLASARRSDLQALHFGGVGLGIAGLLGDDAAPDRGGHRLARRLVRRRRACRRRLRRRRLARRPRPLRRRHPRREPKLPDSPALRKVILAYGLFGLGYIVTATFLVAIVREGDGGRQFEAVVWLATGLAGIPVGLPVEPGRQPHRPAGRLCARPASSRRPASRPASPPAALAGPLVGGILLGAHLHRRDLARLAGWRNCWRRSRRAARWR